MVNDSWFDTLQVRVTPTDAHRRAARRRARSAPRRRSTPSGSASTRRRRSPPSRPSSRRAAWPCRRCTTTPPTGCPIGARDEFLTQTVFNRYHTEHEMLRYLRRLADKDLALDRTMIPLGSCTMKLNATVEMIPITWPELADVHPFAPDEPRRSGYRTMIGQLEQMLVAITGYDAVSLQPNAGSQGELAGLLAIRALPPQPRRRAAHRVPDPLQRPRHQRGERGDGRDARRGRRLRRRRQRRPRRPAGQGRTRPATRSPA